jgi:hypothetical protein
VQAYAGQDASQTHLFVLFDHAGGSCPAVGADDCAVVEFDAARSAAVDHYMLHLGSCAEGAVDVFVNDAKLAEGAERGVDAALGCGPSPSSSIDHPIYEISLPLGSVYPTSVPQVWRTRFPAPPVSAGADADGDGVNDDADLCPFTPNLRQDDDDEDGAGDVCDACPAADVDGDGVPDGEDNCPTVANGSQRDRDQDDVGDACDDCPRDPDDECRKPRDSDRDGWSNGEDDCPAASDPLQLDSDGDGVGDACDPCPFDELNNCMLPAECRECAAADTDGDGVEDDLDNCPSVANADQSDVDHDGVGDVCDSCPTDADDACDEPIDHDGDEIEDSEDACPAVADPDQLDADADGMGDACDPCPTDPDNECTCPAAGIADSDFMEAQNALVTAGTDGATTTTPRVLCAAPKSCQSANPKLVKRFVQRRLLVQRSCLLKGNVACDLHLSDEVGPLPSACRAFGKCLVDSSIELTFGTNAPPSQVLKNTCAKNIGVQGTAFVLKQLSLHMSGHDDQIPAVEAKARKKVAAKCPDPILAGTLGGDCAGVTGKAAAIDCLFTGLKRMIPAP